MKKFFDFLDANPTAFHVVDTVKKELIAKGFTELFENADYKLNDGGKYFVIRNDSSILAFEMPKKQAKGFHVFAAHTDSPSFRVKEQPEMAFEDNYVRLNVEKYGGMIVSTWLDRPLSLAGRLIVKNGNKLETKLVNVDKDLLVIPNVAIHMNSDLNSGYTYKIQSDLLPFLGGIETKGKLDEILAKEAGVDKENVLGKDIFLYARQKASLVGANDEFVIAPRLDDQACCYAGLRGLLDSKSSNYIKVLALFDNEEVGSGTKQGADSTLLDDTLYRIADAMGLSKTEYLKLLADSFSLSADNAHAVHPAMTGKADPTNRPYMNKGVVLKFNGSQRYATDAESAAYFRYLAKEAKVNTQNYANQSDVRGGSTLGNISTAHVSIKTADIGLPQLAMHSAVETMGAGDVKDMIEIAKIFYAK